MKTCKHCNVNIGGNLKHCPLCQSPLKGEDDLPFWPAQKSLQKASILLKILVFLAVSAVIVCYFLDYRLLTVAHPHFSHPVFVYVVIGLPATILYIKSHNSVPRVLLRSMLISSVLIIYTGYFLGKLQLVSDYIIPIIFLGTLIANFVFCFIDAGFTEDSMLCIFCNIVIGIIPNIAMMVRRGDIPLLWNVTFLLSIITLLGIIVFKGRVLVIELQKRFNM